MSLAPLLIVGANPAWQRVVSARNVRLGDVLRVRTEADGPAGKGFNCAQAVFHLGGRPLLIGGCGPGETVWERALQEAGVECASFPLEGPIRTALTLQDTTTGQCTEIVEEGPAASPGSDMLLELLLEQYLPRASTLAVCGSFPGNLSTESVIKSWTRNPIPLVVDSLPMAKNLDSKPPPVRVLVKLNLSEWKTLLGDAPPETLLELAQLRWPTVEVVATLGPDGCIARTAQGRIIRRRPAALPSDQPLHPIGAGDAFTAGLAKVVALQGTLEEGIIEGLSLARASCLHPLPGRFHPGDLRRMRAELAETAWLE